MARTCKIEVKDQEPITSLQGFLRVLLSDGGLDALLVAQHLAGKRALMPTLVADPQKLDGADPLAPAFPTNAARMVSRLTRKALGGRVGAILRPCEIRAFVELVKLKQASPDEVVLIGMDCLGAYSNRDYARLNGSQSSTFQFYRALWDGEGVSSDEISLSPACKACEHPVAKNADLNIGLIGVDMKDHLLLTAHTAKGEELLGRLNLPEVQEPQERSAALKELISRRVAYRDEMYAETSQATADMERLMGYLSRCVNCYNCRVACPVCYCKECVFATDVFDHDPPAYLRWAKRKGLIKMPTDTVFYHLTRLAHMSTACVGCGQCSNACPNDVPVMELFRTIAAYTQKAFSYEAGRSIEEPPPLSTFREGEFDEAVNR